MSIVIWFLHITKTSLFKCTENFMTQKMKNFQIKNFDIFHVSAQNIDCGYSLEPPRRVGSNEYPQSMFLVEKRKIMYTPVNPSFTIYNWGLRGSILYRYVFVMYTVSSRKLLNFRATQHILDYLAFQYKQTSSSPGTSLQWQFILIRVKYLTV